MAEQQKCRKLTAVLVEHQEYFGVMSDDDCQWAIQHPKEAVTFFAEAVKNRIASKSDTVMPEIFHLVVDYNESLDEMITAGRYDWRNDDITAKRFPINGKGIVKYEARYYNFDHNSSSENTVKEIESADTKNPWSAAKIEHLLSFGAKYPDEQRKFPIPGLGSVAEVDGDRHVPCLRRRVSERILRLGWWDCGWGPDFRFLAVRKVSVS